MNQTYCYQIFKYNSFSSNIVFNFNSFWGANR